jgi:hypothetical protein
MPPSFNYDFKMFGNHTGFARVNYELTVYLPDSRNGLSGGWIDHNFEIKVMSNDFQHFMSNRKEIKNTFKMTSLGCLAKGQTTMRTVFEKEHYNCGETAYVLATVDNTNCRTDISRLNASLSMAILVKAKSFKHKDKINVTKISAIGVKKGEKLDGPSTQRLPIAIKGIGDTPTCNTPLISNSFTLEFELIPECLTFCCDKYPKIVLPINVSNQPMKGKGIVWTQPENWNPKKMDPYEGSAQLQMAKLPANVGNMVYPDMPAGGGGVGDGNYHSLENWGEFNDAA